MPPLIELVTSEAAWRQAAAIRQRVFVEEQECPPEEEWDEHDGWRTAARHFLLASDGRAVGTARWRAVDAGAAPTAKLERFAVLPEVRGRGLGRALVEHLLADARSSGFRRFLVHAQGHLESLYAAYGFETVGRPFVEAGIPHVKMLAEES